MLDVDHGTYPFVTSSSTTSGGAAIGVGIAPSSIHAALGIVKAYTTRVGNGPLPTELDEPLGARIRELGNEFGATTGRPRRCGWFDSVVVRYATRINGLTGLAVTKLDVLDTLDRIAMCTAYRIGGELHSEFPGRSRRARERGAAVRVAGGLAEVDGGCSFARRFASRARAPISTGSSRLSDAPISYVSVGTRRDQIIG